MTRGCVIIWCKPGFWVSSFSNFYDYYGVGAASAGRNCWPRVANVGLQHVGQHFVHLAVGWRDACLSARGRSMSSCPTRRRHGSSPSTSRRTIRWRRSVTRSITACMPRDPSRRAAVRTHGRVVRVPHAQHPTRASSRRRRGVAALHATRVAICVFPRRRSIRFASARAAAHLRRDSRARQSRRREIIK